MIVWNPLRPEASVPAQFEDKLVANISGPTAIAFTPDGRMLITTQGGHLRVYKNDALLPTPVLDLTSRICSDTERGLLGVAVDPNFASNHAIYIYYTFKKYNACPRDSSTSPVNRVSRFILPDANQIDPSSEVILVDNIPSPHSNHNGGDLQFGKDGYLYISVGDGGCDYSDPTKCAGSNDAARDRHILLGKILRISGDGTIPPGNPFQGANSARCNVTGITDVGKNCQETYAVGLRNPFRIAFDPNASETRFFINDVGQGQWEEIDEGQVAADYGWNIREGFCATGSTTNCGTPPAGLTNPIYAYGRSAGCTAITGGAFVPNGLWPAQYNGVYLFGDFGCGNIFMLVSGSNGYTASEFTTGVGGVTHLVFSPYIREQALYYATYANGGQIRRITYTESATQSLWVPLIGR